MCCFDIAIVGVGYGKSVSNLENTKSAMPKTAATAIDVSITNNVNLIVCSRVGQLTWLNSDFVSLK